MKRSQRGQSTVELAVCTPFFLAIVVLLLQVVLVGRDEILVTQAAREGARTAAVDPRADAVETAARRATSLDSSRLQVLPGPRPSVGGMTEVLVKYRSRIVMPFTGVTLMQPVVASTAAMRVEGPA